MKVISFDITVSEALIVSRIVDRAMKTTMANLLIAGMTVNRLELEMDIVATHANGCPLDLEAFLHADDSNFNHDIVGIIKHIDRETGELSKLFLPRFALKI